MNPLACRLCLDMGAERPLASSGSHRCFDRKPGLFLHDDLVYH